MNHESIGSDSIDNCPEPLIPADSLRSPLNSNVKAPRVLGATESLVMRYTGYMTLPLLK